MRSLRTMELLCLGILYLYDNNAESLPAFTISPFSRVGTHLRCEIDKSPSEIHIRRIYYQELSLEISFHSFKLCMYVYRERKMGMFGVFRNLNARAREKRGN